MRHARWASVCQDTARRRVRKLDQVLGRLSQIETKLWSSTARRMGMIQTEIVPRYHRDMRAATWVAAFTGLSLLFTNCGIPTPIEQEGDSKQAEQSLPAAPGDGGSSETLPPAAGAEIAKLAGLYSSGGGMQVVFPDGEYWSYSGYGIIQMRHGKITQASAGQFQLQVLMGTGAGSTVTGSYEAGVKLGSVNRLANSDVAPSLNAAAGDWWGNLQDGDTPYLNITSAGVISGYSANFSCRFSGTLSAHPSGLNIFRLSIVRRNCLGGNQSETFTGVARVTGGAIHFAAANADKTRRLTWEGYPD